MTITHGGTRVHWMIGTPIGQVQMPGIANAFFGANSRDEVLMPMEVRPAHLEALLSLYAAASNVGGLICTLPHKAALSRLVHRRSERAALIGMVNVVRKEGLHLVGDMLDGEALVIALKSRGFPVRGSHALVIGCGGFGSAAGFELLRAGARLVDLIDTDAQRSRALADCLERRFGLGRARCMAPGQPFVADLLVQASPQGMCALDEPPVDVRQVRGLRVVVEAVTGRDTRLSQASRAADLDVVTGEEIARAQLQPVLEYWASSSRSPTSPTNDNEKPPQARQRCMETP